MKKLLDNMETHLKYTRDFIKKTYDLSGNFIANMKIVTFDSSNNVLSYLSTDASGVFLPSVKFDSSMVDLSYNIFLLSISILCVSFC